MIVVINNQLLKATGWAFLNKPLKIGIKVNKQTGIQGANLRAFRHTFANHLIMKGVDSRTVQEYLGHSSLQITEKYSHLLKSHKQEAINVLNFNNKVEAKLK